LSQGTGSPIALTVTNTAVIGGPISTISEISLR
jgi:hypothetical protein